MKMKNTKLKSLGIFALVLVMLAGVILPMSAAGSTSKDEDASLAYTVKEGDTLPKLASTYGVSVSKIVSKNGISASDELYAGQKLLIPGAASVEEDSTTTYTASSKVSFSFKDADLKGVLETLIAHTGYTMIFKGDTTNITIALNDVTPLQAIDRVLRMAEMTYIKNDNVLYVGPAEVLNNSFIDSLALTSFRLNYISAENFTSQLSALGINVKLIKSDMNVREFWVSGYPMELAKANELVETLDHKENITYASAGVSSTFTAIEMKYIPAKEFSSLLEALGLHHGLVVESHPMILYVLASGEAYNDILKIKKLVDFEDPEAIRQREEEAKKEAAGEGEGGGSEVVITDGETSLVKVDLKYITKDDATDIVNTFGYEVETLGLALTNKRVWVRGASDEVDKAVAQIKDNDTAENNTAKTFFTYDLKNIVASELQSKIGFTETEDVEFYFGSYPELTKSIVVYCPTNRVNEVKSLIASLDNNLGKMYYPIATITSIDELTVLAAKEELVVKLINVPSVTTASFEVSGDLDPSAEGVRYVLYVLESPENIDLIVDMWGRI